MKDIPDDATLVVGGYILNSFTLPIILCSKNGLDISMRLMFMKRELILPY